MTLTSRLTLLLLGVTLTQPAHALSQAVDSTVVFGTVQGFDGRVPVRADVELRPIREPSRAVRAQVGADGSFRVATAVRGPYRLRAAGVGYVGFERAVPLEAPGTVGVEVRLAGYPDGLAKGPIIGVAAESDAERPRPDVPPAVILAPRGNGRRTGTLTAKRDTVAYRVVDITARIYLSPAGASAYRWAEDGEYEAITTAARGQPVQLLYDSTGVAFGGVSTFRVTNGHPIAPVVAQLDSIFGFTPRRRCLLPALGGTPDPADAVRRDTTLSASLQLVRTLMRTDADCQVHPALGRAVLALFTPTSPLWQLDDVMQRRVVLMAARHASGLSSVSTPEATALVRGAFDASLAVASDTTARFDLYVRAAETFMPSDTVTAQAYTARFVAESNAHPRVLPLLKLTGFNRVLRPGSAVPAFSVASLDAGKPPVTNRALLGKAYLLDVWASWCIDCIVEMPLLRAVHAKYAARGLQLVSVSVDEEQVTADRFRTSREKMPWRHGWAGAWPDGEGPLGAFEVQWLPTTILVGKDGRILAFAPKLDSPEFDALVVRALR